jgi:plasmid stabilization system protein ParE
MEVVMPSWSDKEERQYEHIKENSKKRGASAKRAKAIAARTVNKQRRESGKTPNKKTQGTGNPNKGLASRTKDELYNLAKKKNISGRSSMSKSELVHALEKK